MILLIQPEHRAQIELLHFAVCNQGRASIDNWRERERQELSVAAVPSLSGNFGSNLPLVRCENNLQPLGQGIERGLGTHGRAFKRRRFDPVAQRFGIPYLFSTKT
jgi:hypothetical protein